MLRYDTLVRHPRAFRRLTGLAPAAFDALFADFTATADRLARASRTTRRGRPRRRAAGVGRRHVLGAQTRLLLGLVWLRAYPTYALPGVLFGLEEGNALRNARGVVAVLESLGDFPFDRPDHAPDRHEASSLAEVMDAIPAVRLVIDAKEQRCRRPGGDVAAQKPYHSMKKKARALETQLAARPDGRIESVGDAVPGGSKHDKTVLRESGLLDRLAPGEGAMMDKAYATLRAEHPDRPPVTPEPARRPRNVRRA